MITSIEGVAPAYRGLAYIVFERLALAQFGNRIPQLAFEVFRSGNSVASQVKALNIIPSATEFGYDTQLVTRNADSEPRASAGEVTDAGGGNGVVWCAVMCGVV